MLCNLVLIIFRVENTRSALTAPDGAMAADHDLKLEMHLASVWAGLDLKDYRRLGEEIES